MKKIAIIGTAPLSRDLAPYDDQSWEIWACSPGNMGVLKRVNTYFELHAMVELEAPENQSWSKPYVAWLRQQTFPVYMQEPNELVPQAKIFPINGLIKEFGREWFSSSISMMQAFAVMHLEEGDEIGIFGVDMAADQEHYSAQRSGCRRFIEIAKDRGIKTTIPWESCLGFPPPIYGYSEATPMGRRINVTELMLRQRQAEIKAMLDKTVKEECFFAGAIEQLMYFKRTFVDGENFQIGADKDLLDNLTIAAKRHIEKDAPKIDLKGGDAPTTALAVEVVVPAAPFVNLRAPPWANGHGMADAVHGEGG